MNNNEQYECTVYWIFIKSGRKELYIVLVKQDEVNPKIGPICMEVASFILMATVDIS